MAAPNPGTRDAVINGCSCPVIENCYGKGRYADGSKYGWFVYPDCPLHKMGDWLVVDKQENADGSP